LPVRAPDDRRRRHDLRPARAWGDGRAPAGGGAVTTVKQHAPKVSVADFERIFESVKNWGRWGMDDQRGTLNYITPEHVRKAASLVRSGRTVSMAIPINTVAAPDNPPPAIHYMSQNHDIPVGASRVGFAM